jgi:hypothetical protein
MLFSFLIFPVFVWGIICGVSADEHRYWLAKEELATGFPRASNGPILLRWPFSSGVGPHCPLPPLPPQSSFANRPQNRFPDVRIVFPISHQFGKLIKKGDSFMDYEKLKQDIYEEGAANILAIREESDTDILVDDFKNDKYINFHMVPPAEAWLAGRFVWGPSFGEKNH